MILLILKIGLLLAVIIIPLRPHKLKNERKGNFKIDTDTTKAKYAINENGTLEEIDNHSYID